MYSLLSQLSESKLFPSAQSLKREDKTSLRKKAYLILMALRIILNEEATEDWAHIYIQKTIRAGNFDKWRSDSTDLYAVLHGLVDGDHLHPTPFLKWLQDVRKDQPDNESQTRRLFIKIDDYLAITNTQMKSLRRAVLDWPKLSRDNREQVVIRLLSLLNTTAQRSEIIPMLRKTARSLHLELEPKPVQETPKSFLASLAETASSGATGAASVATVAAPLGGLGPGFSANGHKGIYQGAKPVLLRRGDPPKKKK